MSMKQRISLYLALTLLALTLSVIVVVGFTFRNFGVASAKDKASLAAVLVREGLTVHMKHGIMDKRHDYMKSIGSMSGVDRLWVVRSQSVIEQFGAGFEGESVRDQVAEKVFLSGEPADSIDESWGAVHLRVTIPYEASHDCLQCHTAKLNEVLGAVNMIFDITPMRNDGIWTIARVFLLSFVVLLVMIVASNRGINRYLDLFESLALAIQKGRDGDFSTRVSTKLTDEGGQIAELLNSLFDRLRETVEHVDKKIAILIGGSHQGSENPLVRTGEIVDSLVDIYKFKKTIEIDRDKDEIYAHLATVIRHIAGDGVHFAFYEVTSRGKMEMIFSSREERGCVLKSDESVCEECRALRSETAIYSDDFDGVCGYFKGSESYVCLPFRVTTDTSLLLQFESKDDDAIERIKTKTHSIVNYLEAARPVLESRYLTQVLQESNFHDGLTGLYNRKFLDEFIDHITRQASRTNAPYALLALDIDFFKMVNDTYGHDAGDIVIKGLADTLTGSIREADLAVRQGGEEFLVMLFNTNEDGAMMVAEKIREKFENRAFVAAGATIKKTVSIGVAMYPQDADRMWHAIKLADIALYRAKNNGRNQVVRFQPEMKPIDEKY